MKFEATAANLRQIALTTNRNPVHVTTRKRSHAHGRATIRVFVVPGHVHRQRVSEKAHVDSHWRTAASVQRLWQEICHKSIPRVPRTDSFGEEGVRLPRVRPKVFPEIRTPEPRPYAHWREALRLPPLSRHVRTIEHAERARRKPHRRATSYVRHLRAEFHIEMEPSAA
ncbi:hypothetical protein HPB52_022846 [Rhipicephalus sanguineus]|uniref:Uncharacterized protein n=1 Tax=Rhipicephalus sanguineus TaxID=34632 RepID=A0A9D4SWY3_RHISA|nr:hypothetical protein HPB52_022846 [Rhipicephalus sanguineus]